MAQAQMHAAVPVVQAVQVELQPVPVVQAVKVETAAASNVETAPAAGMEAGSPGLTVPLPPSVPAHLQGGIPPSPRRNPVVELWRKVGGGSLAFSVAVHALIFFIAGVIIFTSSTMQKNVDFLPGGGTAQGAQASQDLAHKVQQKRRNTLTKTVPLQRVVSTGSAALTLPDTPADILDVPDVSSMLGGGGMSGGGFGKGGAGGGFGNGIGVGGLSGITFKPVMMFGLELKDTRKIAVVMDVSRSMTGYLPAVAKELDKIARQSVLVLYFGCGLTKEKGRLDDKVRPAAGEKFDRFWQNWQGKAAVSLTEKERDKLIYNPNLPMPLPEIYKRMAGRASTYFIDFNGITHTQGALMSKEVAEADTIYWFSDFQDAVDEDTIDQVRRRLKARKQKLYIHASVRGRSFEQVRDQLVTPLGGAVIEAEVKKAK